MPKVLILFLFSSLLSVCYAAGTPAPETASVYFISPADGATVKNPVNIRFGLKNMGIAPAGFQVENTGHHHLLLDTGLPALEQPVPNNEQHLHFGKGQTETELTLPPGRHTLQLLLGDHGHVPHQPPVFSAPITITVE